MQILHQPFLPVGITFLETLETASFDVIAESPQQVPSPHHHHRIIISNSEQKDEP